MQSYQCVFQQHPFASLQRADDAAILPLAGALLDPPEIGAAISLAYSRVALTGIAAEAERLQIADGVRATLVFGDDGVHFQGPLVPCLPSNSLRRSTRSGLGPLCAVGPSPNS